MMECKHCKGAINDEHLFCPFCGEKIEKEEPKEEKQEVNESSPDVQNEPAAPLVTDAAPAEKPSNNPKRFTFLLFSIMFVFSLLAISMTLEQKNEIRILEHNLHLLAKQVASKQVPQAGEIATGITGDTQVKQIGRFTDGETNTFVLNVQVSEDVRFNGARLADLTTAQETAFAGELLSESWKKVSEESYACYPNLHIELMKNDQPYAFYDGKSISLH